MAEVRGGYTDGIPRAYYEVTTTTTITRTFVVYAKSPSEARRIGKEWADDLTTNGHVGRSEMYAKSTTVETTVVSARKQDQEGTDHG